MVKVHYDELYFDRRLHLDRRDFSFLDDYLIRVGADSSLHDGDLIWVGGDFSLFNGGLIWIVGDFYRLDAGLILVFVDFSRLDGGLIWVVANFSRRRFNFGRQFSGLSAATWFWLSVTSSGLDAAWSERGSPVSPPRSSLISLSDDTYIAYVPKQRAHKKRKIYKKSDVT